ncbi:MAG: flagellar hook-length control protein FliK [Treponemataceae bacterium]|nr:flagellar hook-length control protein FliK [Treponemataceae bacterium]
MASLNILPAEIDLSGLGNSLNTLSASSNTQTKPLSLQGESFAAFLDRAQNQYTTEGAQKDNYAYKASTRETADSKAEQTAEKKSETEEKAVHDTPKETAARKNENGEDRTEPVTEKANIPADKNTEKILNQGKKTPVDSIMEKILAESAEKITFDEAAAAEEDADILQNVLTDEVFEWLKMPVEQDVESEKETAADSLKIAAKKSEEKTDSVDETLAQISAFLEDNNNQLPDLAEIANADSVTEEEIAEIENLNTKLNSKSENRSEISGKIEIIDERTAVPEKSDSEKLVADNGTVQNYAFAEKVYGKSSDIEKSDLKADEKSVQSADKPDLFVRTVSYDGNGNAEMQLSLPETALPGANPDAAITEGVPRSDFASMLSQEISSNAGEFVRAGSIVLQDNNKGSINLILRPEELGNVKIKLELSDNQISAKIVVATQEAYEAFKQNLNDLKNAFAASGFETNGFDLTWAGSQNGSSGSQGQENQSRQYELAQTVYQDNEPYADESTPQGPDDGYKSSSINLVA